MILNILSSSSRGAQKHICSLSTVSTHKDYLTRCWWKIKSQLKAFIFLQLGVVVCYNKLKTWFYRLLSKASAWNKSTPSTTRQGGLICMLPSPQKMDCFNLNNCTINTAELILSCELLPIRRYLCGFCHVVRVSTISRKNSLPMLVCVPDNKPCADVDVRQIRIPFAWFWDKWKFLKCLGM